MISENAVFNALVNIIPPQGFFDGTIWDILGSLGSIFAGIGLGFTAYEIKQNREARQDAISDKVIEDLQELYSELSLLDRNDPKFDYRLKNWFSAFANMLEYFAFRVNNKVLTDEKRLEFFCPTVLYWYDTIFKEHAGDALNDPKRYEELKKFYRTYKDKYRY